MTPDAKCLLKKVKHDGESEKLWRDAWFRYAASVTHFLHHSSTMSLSSTPVMRLWHYTSKEAALGILSTSSFWATSILYLNDVDEFHHIRDLVSEWIKRTRQPNSLGFPQEYRLLTGRESVFVNFLKRTLLDQRALHTYVVSFSELADDLSQWRAYGSSGGFCLAFQVDKLRLAASLQDFELFECVYDDLAKAALVNELMENALSDFAAVDDQISDVDLSSGLGIYADITPSVTLTALGDRFFLNALQVACRIKNDGFSAEREWRLVSVRQPEPAAMQFRSTKSMLVPYVTFSLAPDGQPVPLDALVVGPSPHVTLNMLSASSLCKARGISGARISRTRLPYRDW